MLDREVKSFHNIVFVNQGYNDFLVLSQPLEHIQAKLESRFIVWVCFFSMLAAQFYQDSRKIDWIKEDVELEELVQDRVLLSFEEVGQDHGLLGWLKWNIVFVDASYELHKYCRNISHR